jgi:hypothetical protein
VPTGPAAPTLARERKSRRGPASLSALTTLSTLPEAGAQGCDGTCAGTINCEALPGMRALRTAVTMTVEGNRARYEREIHPSTGGPSGTFERGEGPHGSRRRGHRHHPGDGQGYSCAADYRGRIGAEATRLTGAQRWKLRESGTIVRRCMLELKRSSS